MTWLSLTRSKCSHVSLHFVIKYAGIFVGMYIYIYISVLIQLWNVEQWSQGEILEQWMYAGVAVWRMEAWGSLFWETQYQPVAEARGRRYEGPELCRLF